MDLSLLLQYALDFLSTLDSLRGEEEFPRCLYEPYGEREKRERQEGIIKMYFEEGKREVGSNSRGMTYIHTSV